MLYYIWITNYIKQCVSFATALQSFATPVQKKLPKPVSMSEGGVMVDIGLGIHIT